MLTIAVSSRALFQLEDSNDVFVNEGQDAFNKYMRDKEHTPLRKGTAFSLVRKLLNLNTPGGKRDKVEVVLLSRNSPDAGMRVMNSIQHYGLDIERAVFSQGHDRFKYAKALGAHLFLSAFAPDVKNAINQGIAAATMLPTKKEDDPSDNSIRIAFDGDSVLFSSEADDCYRANGLDAFRQNEIENCQIPLGPGPFKVFLEELHRLQVMFPLEMSPIRVALVTARGLPAHGRVLHTLRSWDIRIDEGIFAGGTPKGPLLEAFAADIFFDDMVKNIDSAVTHNIPSAHVPYGSGHGIVAS
ncbi:5'-nucleotidase [Nostoc sp. CHAB 5834]|nr:5'-nucleotidase [Nostoc sp. CHAB 5834]